MLKLLSTKDEGKFELNIEYLKNTTIWEDDYDDGEEIEIPEICSKNLQIIVEYIDEYKGEFKEVKYHPITSESKYSDVLTELEQLSLCNLTDEELTSLFNDADYFGLECLKRKIAYCAAMKLTNNISEDTIENLIEIGNLINDIDFKK